MEEPFSASDDTSKVIKILDLYTFIMEYLGGTYISQVEAINHKEAMKIWLDNLKWQEIENFTLNDKLSLIKENFVDEEPMLIEGLKNTWCFLIQTKKGTGFVNYVRTVSC